MFDPDISDTSLLLASSEAAQMGEMKASTKHQVQSKLTWAEGNWGRGA